MALSANEAPRFDPRILVPQVEFTLTSGLFLMIVLPLPLVTGGVLAPPDFPDRAASVALSGCCLRRKITGGGDVIEIGIQRILDHDGIA